MFKDIALNQIHLSTGEQKENQSLIVIEHNNFLEKKMYANLCSQLQGIKFDDRALTYNSKKNALRIFLKHWGVVAVYLFFAGLGCYSLDKNTWLSIFCLLVTMISMIFALTLDPNPNKKLSTNKINTLKEICHFNPAIEEYLVRRYKETGCIRQQDYNYLRAEEQLEKIAEHKKKLLLLRMAQADTPASMAQSAELANITIDTTKTLAWRSKQFKKVAFTWISACTVLCLIAVGLMIVNSFIIFDMLLVLLIAFALLITLVQVLSHFPSMIRKDHVDISDYEKVALLCTTRKENQDYIKSVVAENRPLLHMDLKNMKADRQLAIINKLKVEKFLRK